MHVGPIYIYIYIIYPSFIQVNALFACLSILIYAAYTNQEQQLKSVQKLKKKMVWALYAITFGYNDY